MQYRSIVQFIAPVKHVIVLPDLGQTTNGAKILKWLKNTGDKVAKGEAILTVETDKVDMEVESYANGYLRETLVAEGALATALAPVAVLADSPNEEYDSLPTAAAPIPVAEAPIAAAGKSAAPAPLAAAPAARRLARELGVDLNQLKGTGPQGLITREDVERFAAAASAGPDEIPVRRLKAMAAMTSLSKTQIPHFYVTRDIAMEHAASWRTEWNERHPDRKGDIQRYVRTSSSGGVARCAANEPRTGRRRLQSAEARWCVADGCGRRWPLAGSARRSDGLAMGGLP